MKVGETMRVIHEHNPRPFYFQFDCEFSGCYHWRYEKEGPDLWQVAITKTHFK
jgi:uncharacterized protein (DUF2249 family)